FRDAALIATFLWKSFNHTDQKGQKLIIQIRRYNTGFSPYDLSDILEIDTQFYVRLTVNKLESMVKIRTYYMANIKSKLDNYGKNTETELQDAVNIFAVAEIMDLEDFFENKTLVNSTSMPNNPTSMDYSPKELVNRFLAKELALTQN
ncbi:27533_t:CDS:2, partial [Gigaspora margarita]